MTTARKSAECNLLGPGEVIPWLKVTRDSPVELDRKFGYIISHHKKLAEAESGLRAAMAKDGCKSEVREWQDRIVNNKEWLNFCVQTLSNHVRHAFARCTPNTPDGELLRADGLQRKKHRKNAPVRFRKPRKNSERKIRFYATILEEYKIAKAACAGHSGSNDALVKLIQHARPVIQKFSNSQFKEKDDAEQLIIMSLLKTAKAFSASHKSMARYNTYAWWKARKSVECRATRDCKPGIAVVPDEDGAPGDKKVVGVHSINAPAKGKESARDIYHPAMVATDEGTRVDVAKALALLTDEERVVVVGVLMENKSLRQVAREAEFPARRLRDALERGRSKLRRLLAAFE